MKEYLVLRQVIIECEDEIRNVGYICESDNADRFVENKVKNAIINASNENAKEDNIEKYFDIIIEKTYDYLKENYKRIGKCKANANYEGYFYNNEFDFSTLEELKNHFKL